MEGPAANQAAMGHNPGELTAEHPAPGPQTPLAPKVSNSLALNPIRPAVLKQLPVGIQHPRWGKEHRYSSWFKPATSSITLHSKREIQNFREACGGGVVQGVSASEGGSQQQGVVFRQLGGTGL